MTYSREGHKVTVEFDVTEYATLLAILGLALTLVPRGHAAITDIGKFIEELNRTNPDYGLYMNHEFECSK